MRVGELVCSDAVAISEVGVASLTPHGIRVIWIWLAVISAAAEFGYIAVVRHIRPACREHARLVFGDFTEGHRAPTGPFSCERESTYSRKEVEHLEMRANKTLDRITTPLLGWRLSIGDSGVLVHQGW